MLSTETILTEVESNKTISIKMHSTWNYVFTPELLNPQPVNQKWFTESCHLAHGGP